MSVSTCIDAAIKSAGISHLRAAEIQASAAVAGESVEDSPASCPMMDRLSENPFTSSDSIHLANDLRVRSSNLRSMRR